LKNVRAELLTRPIGPCALIPAGQPGQITINGDAYRLAYISHEFGQVDGYQILKADGTVYDVSADLSTCDCPDGTYRIREGGCRHCVAIRQLRDAELIA
jgi:hypothetical protein